MRFQERPREVDDDMISGLVVCGTTRGRGDTKSPTSTAMRCPWLGEPDVAHLGTVAKRSAHSRHVSARRGIEELINPDPSIKEGASPGWRASLRCKSLGPTMGG